MQICVAGKTYVCVAATNEISGGVFPPGTTHYTQVNPTISIVSQPFCQALADMYLVSLYVLPSWCYSRLLACIASVSLECRAPRAL